MSKRLQVCWISAGVSSFVAGWLEKENTDQFIYIDIADQHKDSLRFIRDCEKELGKEVQILRSDTYANVEEACMAAGIIRSVKGFAPCTAYLKKRVRSEWEEKHKDCEITYVWGFDVGERGRAERIQDAMTQFEHKFPLIENGLTKEDCHGILARLGIARPVMYDLGYSNNNCIGCVKGGMGYWNKIRIDFPKVFVDRAALERRLNSRCLKQCFLDELPPDAGRQTDEIMQDCGIFCELAILGGSDNAAD